MRLFLSSQDFGHYANRAFTMCGGKKRAAVVFNAQDANFDSDREERIARKRAQFEAAGFTFVELDLRQYFDRAKALEAFLEDIDLLWNSGGNTFVLRRAMRASGLDDIVKRRLADDSIMYGGSSAGSCICAPALNGIEMGDDPSPQDVPNDYPSKRTEWDGLNLVPFMIVPHCDQEWFRDEALATTEYLANNNIAYQQLNDGEVVIVNGQNTTVLRPGHDHTRYAPITQKPYCCVPTCVQMVLAKHNLEILPQEQIGTALGLVVSPEYADQFESVVVSEAPVVASGFGTRIQDLNYGLEKLIDSKGWPFTLQKHLASTLVDVEQFSKLLHSIESKNGDALICYQNDKGYGHVVVFDRLIGDNVRIVDPSPLHDKWRLMTIEDIFNRVQSHGDNNIGGVWVLENV